MSQLLEDALRQECHILSLLLHRNHKQHHRTQYFRRLDMIQRSMRRHALLSLPSHIMDLRLALEQSTNMMPNHNQITQIVKVTVSDAIPQVISRIYHAASSLFVELGRGFFVPLCSVGLALISRIRVILMRLGRDAAMLLQQCSLTLPRHVLQHFVELDASAFNKWKRMHTLTLMDSRGSTHSNISAITAVANEHHQLLQEQEQEQETINSQVFDTIDIETQSRSQSQSPLVPEDCRVDELTAHRKSSTIIFNDTFASFHVDVDVDGNATLDRNEQIISYAKQIKKIHASSERKKAREGGTGIIDTSSTKKKKKMKSILDDIFGE